MGEHDSPITVSRAGLRAQGPRTKNRLRSLSLPTRPAGGQLDWESSCAA